MDTLQGLQEHIELEYAEAISARDEVLLALDAAPGMGPPDLCWLQKTPKTTGWGGGKLQTESSRGYYHYVLGRDVSSSAAVAAYFAQLNARVEAPGMLQGLWLSAEWVITRGFYCCYDPISSLDIRCELAVPGGVNVGAVDARGDVHDVTPDMWRRAQVVAFMRSLLYDAEMQLNGGCVASYDMAASPAAERQLLGFVAGLYAGGELPAGLEPVSTAQGYGVAPEHMDLALAAVLHHFRRRQRWAAALAFFNTLAAQYYPTAAVCSAVALRALGRSSEVACVLGAALERDPGSAPLLAAMAAECLAQKQLEMAADLARRALKLRPGARPAWLLLARAFAGAGQHSAALVALNVLPTPPLPRDEGELLHVVLPPNKTRELTQPQVMEYDPDVEAVRQMAAEDASLAGASRLLAYLPGAILVNREPLDAAPWPDVSPNRVTRASLAAVYSVLQDIVDALSWDAFLDVRSRVFLMHQEQAAAHVQAQAEAQAAAEVEVACAQEQQPQAHAHAEEQQLQAAQPVPELRPQLGSCGQKQAAAAALPASSAAPDAGAAASGSAATNQAAASKPPAPPLVPAQQRRSVPASPLHLAPKGRHSRAGSVQGSSRGSPTQLLCQPAAGAGAGAVGG